MLNCRFLGKLKLSFVNYRRWSISNVEETRTDGWTWTRLVIRLHNQIDWFEIIKYTLFRTRQQSSTPQLLHLYRTGGVACGTLINEYGVSYLLL